MIGRVRFFSVALMAVAAVSMAGCGSSSKKKEKFAYVERPVETLYLEATNALERNRFEEAIELFSEVERQHPYSAWARRSMLMKAFAQYEENDYDEAVATLDQFIALHPGNKDAPYAYYLRAMAFYVRIRDVGRDQDYTNNAVAALNDVARRYPESEYARDARLKLDLTFDHLAGKEMYVGRYYQRNGKIVSAINRFRFVVDNYETTNHAQEALYRLVENYLTIGVIDEARSAAAVLGHNYPGSDWYQAAYELMDRQGVLEPGAKMKRDRKLVKLQAKEDELREKAAALNADADKPVIAPPADDLLNDEVASPTDPRE
jgi:outer membrane protein assembly factor BamD